MGGSSSSKKSSITIRYAPYIENRYNYFLVDAWEYVLDAQDTPPTYDGLGDYIIDSFLGAGLFLSSYPAMYDMYGKFMAGLDIEDIWKRSFRDRMTVSEIGDLADASANLDSDINTKIIDRFLLDARSLGVVNTSSFVVEKAKIEKSFFYKTSAFRKEVQFARIEDDTIFDAILNWQNKVQINYAICMKLLIHCMSLSDAATYDASAKETLWPLSVGNEYGRYLGLYAGAVRLVQEVNKRGRSMLSQNLYVLSEAISGAGFGYLWGPYGAAIGAQIGTAKGLSDIMVEEGKTMWWAPYVFGPEPGFFYLLLP